MKTAVTAFTALIFFGLFALPVSVSAQPPFFEGYSRIVQIGEFNIVLAPGEDYRRSDGFDGFYTTRGHYRPDGFGGFYSPKGEHVRPDGFGGFITGKGHYLSDGAGGVYAPNGKHIKARGNKGFLIFSKADI